MMITPETPVLPVLPVEDSETVAVTPALPARKTRAKKAATKKSAAKKAVAKKATAKKATAKKVGAKKAVAKKPAARKPAEKKTSAKLYRVRGSDIHGRGVFAVSDIPKGTTIGEYRGKRMSWDEALELPPSDPNDSAHTFFFELSDGTIINGGIDGNDLRWVNHSCKPNAESYEDEESRVFINAIRNIKAGDEITYDYKLSVDGKLSKEEMEDYVCRCGAKKCRGYLIKQKKKDKKKSKKDKKKKNKKNK